MTDHHVDSQSGTARATIHSTRHDPVAESSARFGTNMATALFVILGGVLAYLGGVLLNQGGTLPSGPNNLFYLTVVGMLIAYLVTRAPARRVGRLWSRTVSRVSRVTPDVVLAAGDGASLSSDHVKR